MVVTVVVVVVVVVVITRPVALSVEVFTVAPCADASELLMVGTFCSLFGALLFTSLPP